MRFYVRENSERKTQICRFNPLASQTRNRETAAKQFRYETILCNGTTAVPRLANTGKQRGLSRGKFLPTKSITRVDFSFSLSRSERGNKKQLQNVTIGQRPCSTIGRSSLN